MRLPKGDILHIILGGMERPVPDEERRAPYSKGQKGGPVTVVLVDDAQEVRGVVRAQLTLTGHFDVVAEGSTGTEAVALAAAHRPQLLVLDASMPDMDGLEAIGAILEVSPLTQVVMLSGFSSDSLSKAALERGALDFVDKGIPVRQLPGRLLKALSLPVPVHLGQVPTGTVDAEMVLARHLERFRTFFDQAAIGMATMTLTGTIVRANAALCDMLGQSETALVGQLYGELAPAAHAGSLLGAIASVGSGERDVADMDHPVERTKLWLHSTFAAVRGTDGRPLYLFAQADDVTNRRQALRELHQSDQRFRLLVEGVRDYAIFMLDPEGRVSSWNLGAQRMKGYATDEIIGRHFRVFYPPAAQAVKHPEYELEVAAREGRYQEEGWRVRQDGSQFWANVLITAIVDEVGHLICFAKVTRDVTERRDANERLRLAAEQTAQFVTLTAHELRSPVAALTGGADLLSAHWGALSDADRQSTLENMAQAGRRLKRLVDDLLVASCLEAGSFGFTLEDMAVAPSIAEAVAELPPAEGGQVQVEADAGLMVQADRARFVQIMTNLLANAARHGAPPVRVQATQAGSSVVIRVSDGGGGVPSEFAPILFEKFSQAPGKSRRGTGLGLFIVRELARGQGGEAWYETTHEGLGSFAFSLPTGPPSVANPATVANGAVIGETGTATAPGPIGH